MNGQDQRSSTRSVGTGPVSSFPQYVDSSLTEMPTMRQGQNAISYATNAGNIPNHYDLTDEIPFDDADNDLPMYWKCLSNEDKQGYLSLKNDIKPFITRTVRKDKAKKFVSILYRINSYIYSGAINQTPYRALVCGLVWLDDAKKEACAVCTRQLTKLISRCKSSVNDLFKSLGLSNAENTTDYAAKLTNYFPFLKDNCIEIRQWTIRAKINVGHVNKTSNHGRNREIPIINSRSTENRRGAISRSLNRGNSITKVPQNDNTQSIFNSYNGNQSAANSLENQDVPKYIHQESIPQPTMNFFDCLADDCFDDLDGMSIFE